jgi:hypothetical protein
VNNIHIEGLEDSEPDMTDNLVTREELLEAIRYDCVTFFAFYLEEELTLEVPDMHKEIWDELLSYLEIARNPKFVKGFLRKLFCVPRGHAKSTLAKLSIILFMRYSPFRFVVYASNTITIAVQAIKDIIKWLGSPNETNLYGRKRDKWIEKANESQGLWIVHIPTPQYGEKRVIMKAIGADSQIRGMLIDNMRPEFMVFDDCEGYETCSSDITQARLDAWLMGAALKARAKRALVIMLGNLLSEKTALCRFTKDPKWNPTVFGALVRDKTTNEIIPIWPGLYTKEELIDEYREYRHNGTGHIWVHEMMNLTAEKIFGMDMVNVVQIPMPTPDQISSGFIVLDPAFGLKQFHDKSSITVHVQIKAEFHGHGIPHVVQSKTDHMDEEALLDSMLEFSLYWGIKTWCIETRAAQQLFIPLFRNMLRIRGLNPDAFLVLPVLGGQDSKFTRIKAMKTAVSKGSYGIVEEEGILLDKLATYNESVTKDDDLQDSAAFGLIVWDMHGTTVEEQGITHIAAELMGTNEIFQNKSQLDYAPM